MEKSMINNLRDLVEKAAEEYGDKVFVKEKAGKEIVEKTYNDMLSDTRKLSNYLLTEKSGKLHAAVIGPTSYAYLVAYFGTVSAGNVIVPLDAQLPCPDLCELLQRADVTVFFYDARYTPMLPAIKAACPGVKIYICLQETEGGLSVPEILGKYEPAVNLPAISSDDLCAILYTSGTTGKSKGVMLTHRNLAENATCLDMKFPPRSVLLSVLPIHHAYCLTMDILKGIDCGSIICINDSLIRMVKNFKVFIIFHIFTP